MKLILKPACADIEIKKSKFIAHLKPVTTKEEAEEHVKEIKKLHHRATHNVFCYLIGENYDFEKYSDDGEPSGTAGLPMLSMLKNEGYINLAAVVTRYFGGIKLGTGGLVRAYTSAVKEALLTADIGEIGDFTVLDFDIDYALKMQLEHKLKSIENYVDEIVYAENIRYKLYVRRGDKDELLEYLRDLRKGKPIVTSDVRAYVVRRGAEGLGGGEYSLEIL